MDVLICDVFTLQVHNILLNLFDSIDFPLFSFPAWENFVNTALKKKEQAELDAEEL